VNLKVDLAGSASVLVIGAGAAGGNAVVRLAERLRQDGEEDLAKRVLWVSNSFAWGTSRCSGSDKQTYYKLGTSPAAAVAAVEWAATLTRGGCCHHDTALVEAVGSLREFYHLVDLGVPFPHDAFGAFAGYQTDNDPYQSATSAGPLTSRYMSEALEAKAERLGVPRRDGLELVDLERRGDRWVGVFFDLNAARSGETRLVAIDSRFVVVATGGPGMLFATRVYPPGIFSVHGLLLARGAAGVNLSEWQFGLASVRPRWNVSGSYLQAIPRLFSVDEHGAERDFLNDCLPRIERQASLIFLKGYQWPFDVDHLPDASSLVDLAVYREQLAGRRVFLDFRANPRSDAGRFAIEALQPEARDYLQSRSATHETPYERLAAINPPAVEFYREHGVDLRVEPLEIAACAQHNNGGIQVDLDWQSDLPDLYVVGELAGTHGVRRPGGSALNAGQVGAHRAARAIFDRLRQMKDGGSAAIDSQELSGRYSRKLDGKLSGREVIGRVQLAMDRAARVMRERGQVERTLDELSGLYRQARTDGWRGDSAEAARDAFRAENLLLTAIAYLQNILAYLQAGGGSRGSALVRSDQGKPIHEKLTDPDGRPWRYVPENQDLRGCIFATRFDPNHSHFFRTERISVRRCDYQPEPFEKVYMKCLQSRQGQAAVDVDHGAG